MKSLDGRVALVTGAGRGIGREIALLLARRGAKVVVNDLGGDWRGEGADEGPVADVCREIAEAGGTAVGDGGSVSDVDDAARMVQRAIDEFGQLDIVVNNAGILRDKMVFSMSDDDWDACIAVHLRGHFLVTRAACAAWRARAKETGAPVDGRVLCMTSEAGLYGNVGQANYSAAKAGIASFAVTVAREMQRYGVTCNAIAPRARTRMTEGTFGTLPGGSGGTDPWGPASVAPIVAALAGPNGSRYTGQVFVCGGGVAQVIAPYSVAAEVSFGDQPEVEDLEAFLSDSLGTQAGPAPFPDLGLTPVNRP
ncbi:SDR family NAD(P)-dependent oxidoreductase [Patulibacter brassicae]|jgi:3-oxoacyl-[acyl-carrier protein] reductase|uniref:SDR family NAD(P)-dependent oxidoreductase n=1 Tax=Patulibacter brassicae TaxID=1705717 RepID=A0ABU4VFU9_9ACTN|nr:SDR family NAD(P)-dependent oxidoreductase [Patulibacter brassicae]MDX8150700.1 SDR family NAD(P)-dependent oxidoreductase [Patulibacter brassicae]